MEALCGCRVYFWVGLTEKGWDKVLALMLGTPTMAEHMGHFPWASQFPSEGSSESPAWSLEARAFMRPGENEEEKLKGIGAVGCARPHHCHPHLGSLQVVTVQLGPVGGGRGVVRNKQG